MTSSYQDQHDAFLKVIAGRNSCLHLGHIDENFVKTLPGRHSTSIDDNSLYDAVIAIDVFEKETNPRLLLQKINKRLKVGGVLVSTFDNSQFGLRINDLILGDDVVGELAYTTQGFFRLLLDIGYIPYFAGGASTSTIPQKLLSHLDDNERGHASKQLMTFAKIVFIAEKLPEVHCNDFDGVAFAVCTRGEKRTIRNNLETSSEFNDPINERYIVYNSTSPRKAFDAASVSKKKLIVYMHDDVFIPAGWSRRVWKQFFEEDSKSPVGVAGLFGVGGDRSAGNRFHGGLVVDLMGMRTLRDGSNPVNVRTLDGLCLIVKNGSGILPDPDMGFHFYDADVCMQAESRNERVIALMAPALHSSVVINPPPEFNHSMELFKSKWNNKLPVETPCALVK